MLCVLQICGWIIVQTDVLILNLLMLAHNLALVLYRYVELKDSHGATPTTHHQQTTLYTEKTYMYI